MSGRSGTGSAGASDADLEIDVHNLPLGKKRGDESFVDGYRRKGPEGLTRELVVLEVDEKGVAKVAEKVRQLIDRKITSFVVNMSAVPTIAGETVKELVRAKKLAEEKGGYFSLAGAKDAVGGLLKVMGLDKEIPSYASLEKAVDDFKNSLKEQISRKAGSSSRPPAPAAAAPAATAPAAAAPAAASASSDKAKRKGTVEVKAPVAAKADDEKKTKTSPGGPKFDVEGEDKKKKTEPASPKFEVDEDEEEKRPAKTAQFAAPKFDEDEEEKRPAKTAQFAAPKFDEDEEEKRPAKTDQFAAPKFDDEPAPPKKKTEPEKPAAKPKTDAERPATSPVEKKPAPTDMKDLKTQAMAGLSREEALRLASAEAAGRAAEGAGKDKPVASGKPAPAPAPAKAAPPPAAAAKPDARAMKTEAMPGLSREEALRLAGVDAAAKDKPAPAAPAAKADPRAMKTEAMPGLSREEALRLASGEGKAGAAAPPKTGEHKVQKSDMFPSPVKEEPKPPARPSGEVKTKTDMMPALSKEDVAKMTSEAAPKSGAPAGEKVQKTEVLKAYDPSALSDVNTTEAVSRAELEKLAAKGTGKVAAVPPAKGDQKAGKTEVLRAATPGDMGSSKTEMMPGMSREEAMRLASETTNKQVAPKPGAKSTAEIKSARTEMMPGMSKEEAQRLAGGPKSGAVPVQRTEQLKAFDPSKVGEDKSDLKAKRTEAMPGLSKEEAVRLAGKQDPQALRTEMMPGMSRSEAAEMVKGGGADPQALKTDSMKGLDKGAAKKEVEKIEYQSAKTQALGGMTKDEAQREMKTERDLVADRPKESDEDAEGEEKEAVGKKSPVLMIVGVLAVVVAAVFFFMSQDKKPAKLSPTQQTKVRAAFLDAMNLDE